MKCQNCKLGRLYPAIPHENFPESGLQCDVCHGSGILPEYLDYLPEQGKLLKENRIKNNVHLKDEAHRLKIDMRKLSLMERGYFRKDISQHKRNKDEKS